MFFRQQRISTGLVLAATLVSVSLLPIKSLAEEKPADLNGEPDILTQEALKRADKETHAETHAEKSAENAAERKSEQRVKEPELMIDEGLPDKLSKRPLVRPTVETKTKTLPAPLPAASTLSAPSAPTTSAKAPAAARPASAKTGATTSSVSAVSPTSPAVAPLNVEPDIALRWLQNGNARFVKKNFRADGRLPQDRAKLLNGQHPHAIILSCSDSQVPPEVVFDQGLGEIYVVRVAGETLDASSVASIEYAVDRLKARLLVVMGHSQCGALDLALSKAEGTSLGSADLDIMAASILPHLKTVANDPRSPSLEVEATLNADGVGRDLLKRSDLLRAKVETGELKIKTALYRIDSGKVTFY